VRQENPSASTTAHGFSRTAGRIVVFGDGDADVVMAALGAEVAGQAAAVVADLRHEPGAAQDFAWPT
jgi:hypothetical protein